MKIKIGEKDYSQEYKNNKSLNPPHRKTRKDKKICVNTPIHQETHEMLKRLALSCNLTKTHLMAEIVDIMLNNEQFVNWIQDKYEADRYRVIPVRENGKLFY